MMRLCTLLGLLLSSCCILAQEGKKKDGMAAFQNGTLIPNYGKIAQVDGMEPLPANARFKVSFDVAKPAAAGKLNRALASGARFLNMHAASGIKPEHMELAFVIHGRAVHDVTIDAHYQSKRGQANANAGLITALQQQGVQVYVCGQSAAFHGVGKEQLLPGVKLALSAMTAHALLQQQGYTLNPF